MAGRAADARRQSQAERTPGAWGPTRPSPIRGRSSRVRWPVPPREPEAKSARAGGRGDLLATALRAILRWQGSHTENQWDGRIPRRSCGPRSLRPAPRFVEMAHRIVSGERRRPVGRARAPAHAGPAPALDSDAARLHGWIATSPTPLKRAAREASPFIALNYWAADAGHLSLSAARAGPFDDATRALGLEPLQNAPAPVGCSPGDHPALVGRADLTRVRRDPARAVATATRAGPRPCWAAAARC